MRSCAIPYSSATDDLRDYSFERSKTNIEVNLELKNKFVEAVKVTPEKLRKD